MTEFSGVDLEGTLLKEELSASDVVAARRLAFSTKESMRALRDLVAKLESSASGTNAKLALAACYWVEGKYSRALDASRETAGEAAAFISARSLLALGKPAEARDALKSHVSRAKCGEMHAAYAEAVRKCGDRASAATAASEAMGKLGACAALHVEAGIAADLSGDCEAARAHYQKALECDGDNVEALFRLAYISDLHGDEDTAVELYRRCASIRPVRTKALLNLGLLYEEMGRDYDAIRCYRLVNESHPTDFRARLCLRDAEAGGDMYFDEEQQKKRERRNKILETPITDFELSVRSRNCLEKMNVTTLGDLCRISEQELLSFKNFGETSLNEIKQIMGAKGLRLGQSLEGDDGKPAKIKALRKRPVDTEKLMAKSIDDLGLSVRSQHCMQTLGIQTIGDLVSRSEKELLDARNFGATSLAEVRKKLGLFGLALAE